MIELIIDILQIIALSIIGWRVFSRPVYHRYALYYTTDDNKIMGLNPGRGAELIHDAGRPVVGMTAHHECSVEQNHVLISPGSDST